MKQRIMEEVIFGVLILILVASGGSAKACQSGDVYVDRFQRTVQDLEYDLNAVRSGQLRSSRFPLDMLENELREDFDCIEKVCTVDQQAQILKYWKRFEEIIKTGELKSPKPLVDPRFTPQRR